MSKYGIVAKRGAYRQESAKVIVALSQGGQNREQHAIMKCKKNIPVSDDNDGER